MDAQLKKIAITPAKFDSEGEITTEECATLTLDVPLDSTSQREAIMELMDLLSAEWIVVEMESRQQRMNFGKQQSEESE